MSVQSSLRSVVAATAFGLAVAVAVAGPALAAHVVVYGPESYTSADASTGDSSAGADIRNGVPNPANGYNYANGIATTETHSLTPSGSTVTASVSTASAGAPGRTSAASTYSSLDTGIMRAAIVQTPPSAYGYPLADTTTHFQETFFFSNTSGHAVNLDLNFSFDGTAPVLTDSSLNGLAYLILSSCGSCSNAQSQGITFAGSGHDATVAAYSLFNQGGVYSVYDQFAGALNPLDFSVQTNTNGISTILHTTIAIPTGDTSLGFSTLLSLSARGGASADFSHTAQFGIGDLADGLTFTSASGVFLSGIKTPTGAVPEPATWAMMLVGFGLVGSVARRRRASGTFTVA